MTKNYETFAPDAQDQRQNDELLWQFLTSHAATPVQIDLSGVPELTAARLQLLISARKQWIADGVPMAIAGMTQTHRQGLARMGVPEDFFEKGSL
jgi:anti-anti-sigma regulatory factor